LSETATRCQVCGTVLNPAAGSKSAAKTVQGSRMPEITLSLPSAMGLLALFVTIGAVLVYFVLHGMGGAKPTASGTVTPTATITLTATASLPPTNTATPTVEATATPLPPVSYKVVSGDTCLLIAGKYHLAQDLSSRDAIVNANPGVINADCTNLIEGRTINVPQPTPTATVAPSQPASTAQAASGTQCPTDTYTVKDGDTLGSIAANYAVTQKDIKDFNGMLNDIVFSGMPLKIPLCHRTTDPTATPTTPPPYSAPSLLLPADGATFTVANDTVTLQWSQVGELRPNEAYAVTIEDITEGKGRKLTEYVTDTKYIVPAAFRPTDASPHVLRWTVIPVRQAGTTKDNQPIWSPAGTVSASRDFIWSGSVAAPTATP
jgi:LysM repeat protein